MVSIAPSQSSVSPCTSDRACCPAAEMTERELRQAFGLRRTRQLMARQLNRRDSRRLGHHYGRCKLYKRAEAEVRCCCTVVGSPVCRSDTRTQALAKQLGLVPDNAPADADQGNEANSGSDE